jgi:NADH dehydrogenase
MKANILVVGGGFAGFWAAVAARRVAGARADICLVSREPVLQVRPRLYEANPASLVADLRAPLSLVDVKLICDEAVELDHRRAAVALRSGVELS